MSRENDKRRTELLIELQRQKLRLDDETANAQGKYEDLQRHRAANKEARLRLEQPLPSGDFCFDCWFNHGQRVQMVNRPEQPVRPMRDRFVCPVCPNEEIRHA